MDWFAAVERLSELFPSNTYWSSLYHALIAIEGAGHEAGFSRVY